MFRKHVVPGLMLSLLRVVGVGVVLFLLLNLGKIQAVLEQ